MNRDGLSCLIDSICMLGNWEKYTNMLLIYGQTQENQEIALRINSHLDTFSRSVHI